MTDHNQALDAAILAAGFDPRNPAVREAWRAGIAAYIGMRNGEAVAWTTQTQLDALKASPGGNHIMWGEPLPYHPDTPLFAAPVFASGEKVKVKPLKWREWTNGSRGWQADAVLGQYQVSYLREYEEWQLYCPGKSSTWANCFSRHASSGAAKAAAQADYEQRILSALASLPTDDRKGNGNG